MRIEAIILKKIAIKEHDELIVCYTRDFGKQVYHTKSSLRHTSKQASHLDVLNHTEFSLAESKQMPIIISALCLEGMRFLKQSLPALSISYFLLECFDKLVFEAEADPRLWDFLLGSLRRLNTEAHTSRAEWIEIFDSLQAELLDVMGYDSTMSIEHIAQMPITTLHLAQRVLQLSRL